MEKEYFVKIPKWIARNSEISPFAKALYIALRSYKPIFPSYSRLCKDTGINSPTTISKYLKELVYLDLITVHKSGFNRSNTYLINDRPFNGIFNQNMDSNIPKNELNENHKMESNKINIKISNKGNEDSSVSNTEDPLAKPATEQETNESLSKILKGLQ